MDIKTCYDAIYFGSDFEFKYKNYFYFINSGVNNKKLHNITVSKSLTSFYHGEEVKDVKMIYEKNNINMNKNVEEFFNAKIFENKSFNEIYNEITDINY